jgi:hypothetical protein
VLGSPTKALTTSAYRQIIHLVYQYLPCGVNRDSFLPLRDNPQSASDHAMSMIYHAFSFLGISVSASCSAGHSKGTSTHTSIGNGAATKPSYGYTDIWTGHGRLSKSMFLVARSLWLQLDKHRRPGCGVPALDHSTHHPSDVNALPVSGS